jgi:hypothetical protein
MIVLVETFALLYLIRLHTPEGKEIAVNAASVVTLRAPRTEEEHFPKGAKCILNMADGKFNLVVEDCETVRRLIEEAEQ